VLQEFRQAARFSLRAVLVLAVVMNGTALPSAASAMATTDTGLHSEHGGHGGMSDENRSGQPTDMSSTDCCDGTACGCGCAVPATILSLVLAPRAYESSPANVIFVETLHPSSAIGALFRPPA